jgi:hypothetical protein
VYTKCPTTWNTRTSTPTYQREVAREPSRRGGGDVYVVPVPCLPMRRFEGVLVEGAEDEAEEDDDDFEDDDDVDAGERRRGRAATGGEETSDPLV